MKQSPHILLLPGWQGSGDDHWQSHWERRYGYQRVQQHDWQRPLRGDWTARLEECVLDAPAPVVLVAHSPGACRTLGVESENVPQRDQFLPDSPPHSGTMGQEDGEKWAAAAHSQPTIPKSDRLLGCILTAWWAAHSRHTVRVQAALLVAPGDVEQPELAAQLPGWAPMARKPLPFTSWLVASRDDPYCSFARAQALAADWGARLIDHGARGHINAESGLGAWPAGKALLDSLLAV